MLQYQGETYLGFYNKEVDKGGLTMGGETNAGNIGKGNGKPVRFDKLPVPWLLASGFKRYYFQDEPFYWSDKIRYGAVYRHNQWWGLPDFQIRADTLLESWDKVQTRVWWEKTYGMGNP
jgi:hypothetical protein